MSLQSPLKEEQKPCPVGKYIPPSMVKKFDNAILELDKLCKTVLPRYETLDYSLMIKHAIILFRTNCYYWSYNVDSRDASLVFVPLNNEELFVLHFPDKTDCCKSNVTIKWKITMHWVRSYEKPMEPFMFGPFGFERCDRWLHPIPQEVSNPFTMTRNVRDERRFMSRLFKNKYWRCQKVGRTFTVPKVHSPTQKILPACKRPQLVVDSDYGLDFAEGRCDSSSEEDDTCVSNDWEDDRDRPESNELALVASEEHSVLSIEPDDASESMSFVDSPMLLDEEASACISWQSLQIVDNDENESFILLDDNDSISMRDEWSVITSSAEVDSVNSRHPTSYKDAVVLTPTTKQCHNNKIGARNSCRNKQHFISAILEDSVTNDDYLPDFDDVFIRNGAKNGQGGKQRLRFKGNQRKQNVLR